MDVLEKSGHTTSEFAALIIGVVLVVFTIVVENALQWTINDQTKALEEYIIGAIVIYVCGRSALKWRQLGTAITNKLKTLAADAAQPPAPPKP